MAAEDPNDRSNLGLINDKTIRVKPGNMLLSHLSQNQQLASTVGKQYLTIGDIKIIMNNMHSKGVYLNDILEDSELVVPSLETPPRNPELDARTENLKKMLAQQNYNQMTKNVDFTTKYKPEDSIGYQMRQINNGLLGVFQFVISIGAAFMFGFMGLDTFLGLSFELPVRLLWGIICAMIVAAAELYFLVVNLELSESPQQTSIKSDTSSKKLN